VARVESVARVEKEREREARVEREIEGARLGLGVEREREASRQEERERALSCKIIYVVYGKSEYASSIIKIYVHM